jgi:hypothetical protein
MKTPVLSSSRLVLAMLASGVIGAAGFGALSSTHASSAATTAPAPVAAAAAPAVTTPDFAQITAQHGAAVVNISVAGTSKASAGGLELDPSDPFSEFFRQFPGPRGRGGPQQGMPTRGQGSGFIVSADGTILTNAHVVQDATEVTVKLTDRREFKAKVLGSDPRTDVAVIKIDAKGLPTVHAGQHPQPARGRMGAGHRLAVRPGKHRDRRRGQRQGPHAARRQLRALHPDRRGGEPRQLRRPAVQRARARWWASTRRSTAAPAATRACRLRSRSKSPPRSKTRS